MRKAIMRMVTWGLMAALVCATVASAATTTSVKKKKGPAPKEHHFITVQDGSRLSTTGNRFEDVFRIKRSPFGEGAVIRDAVVSGTNFPVSGADTAITYDHGGRTVAHESFTLGTPDANGYGTITGKGTCERRAGTGLHLDESCTYTFKGNYDLITGQVNMALTGTYTTSPKAIKVS
jgi:hypothetical protein